MKQRTIPACLATAWPANPHQTEQCQNKQGQIKQNLLRPRKRRQHQVKMLCCSVAVSMAASVCGNSYAATEQEQIEALRQEVSALKQMVQQLSAQQATNQQTGGQQTASQQQATANTSVNHTAPASGLSATAVIPASASLAPAQTAQVGQPMPDVVATTKPEGWATLPDGKTRAKLYGFIRADLIHDFKGQPSGKFSNLHTQPLDSTDPVNNKTAWTAAVTRIGVDLKTPSPMGEIGGKIEGDFWGNGGTGAATFRIRHAYLTHGNWLVGQSWSPFAGTEYTAETVDFNWVVGASYRRVPQLRYTYPLNSASTLTIAAEENNASEARFPVLVGRFEHQLADKQGAFAIRALVHDKRGVASTTVNGQTQNRTDEKTGYGAAIGAWYQLNAANKLMGQFFHVKGEGNFNSGTGPGFTVNKQTGALYFDEYNSSQLGITHTFNPQLRSTLALSWVDFKDNSQFALSNSGANQTLKQASLNLFYKPLAALDLGAEYTYGTREVFSGDQGTQSRINLMARYNF